MSAYCNSGISKTKMGRFLKVAAVYLIHIFIYKKGLWPFFLFLIQIPLF
ncbi:hypothetical protein SPHINGO8BC_60675 [Sphingobacterium multivorum]|uniref:Uncharacterized protein n=1 Tax=Sphingobacterium multivorum TaxID=28454 RepID=A0A654DKM3_SPHMU|nr:hypothetical protein SPHINGO8BC_60675 [Sphingobacterium multivorum]